MEFYCVPTPFPEWNSLPFPYFFQTWWPTFPTNFTWNCVKSFYLWRIFQKYWIWEDMFFFNNLVLSVVKYPPFNFWIELYFPHLQKHEIPYIFLTFSPISQPFLTLSANSLPLQGLKKIKSDSWLFQDFPYPWEPCLFGVYIWLSTVVDFSWKKCYVFYLYFLHAEYKVWIGSGSAVVQGWFYTMHLQNTMYLITYTYTFNIKYNFN